MPNYKVIEIEIYGRLTKCKLLAIHPAGTIDVERISDGACFRVSGLWGYK